MEKTLRVFAVLIFATMVTACSGGGDASTPTGSATISGVAAKGIIKAGSVTADEIGTDGKKIRTVGTTKTDKNGRYEITLDSSYQGGVLKVTIKKTTNTKMKCDVFTGCGIKSFGDWMVWPGVFHMDALVPWAPPGRNRVQITPFTHMAMARARQRWVEGKPITKKIAAEVNSEVSQIVGVDIIKTEMVDITDIGALNSAGPDARHNALFNAGMAGVLNPTGPGETIFSKLEDLASSFKDGKFDGTDPIKIKKITAEVRKAANAAAADPNFAKPLRNEIAVVNAVIAQTEKAVADSSDGKTYDPKASAVAGTTPVEQAKALLKNGRAFVEQIDSNFASPADALDVDMTTIQTILNNGDVATMGTMLGETISQVLAFLNTKTITELLTTATYPIHITDIAGNVYGTVTAETTVANTGITFKINGTLTGSGTSVTITDLVLATNLTTTDISVAANIITSLTLGNTQVTLTGEISNADGSKKIVLNNTILKVTATAPIMVDPASNTDPDLSALATASFSGKVTINVDPYSFTGDAAIDLIALDPTITPQPPMPMGLQKIALNGSFTSPTAGTFASKATLTIDNATSFDIFGYLDSPDGFENANNFIKGTLTVTDTATVPNMPGITATATVSRTSLNGGDASLIVSYNGETFTLKAESADVNNLSGTGILYLTNPDGVKFKFVSSLDNAGHITGGTVYVGTVTVGEITTTNGFAIVRYSDGTFESLY